MLRKGLFGQKIKWLILSIIFGLVFLSGQIIEAKNRPIFVSELEGTITAGQRNYLERQLEFARQNDAQLFILELNTPGGLVEATLDINRLFLNAEIPIVVLVAPSGAIAGSAGAFILISSDIAAMAPGTTVGAAQPVAISPEGTSAVDEKTTTFYASHLRSMAREKGRPEDIAEKIVKENLTLNAREALEEGLIEYIANDRYDLLRQLDRKTIVKQGVTYYLSTGEPTFIREEMNLRERFQDWLSDPQIAFLMLMAGVMLVYFGLNAPGTIVPEVSGVIMVILGIYGIGFFDTNTAGIVLILLGLGLLVAEVVTSGFGILGIGGAISLVAGAVMLPIEPLMARDWYTSFLVTVVGTVLGLVIVILFIAQRVISSRRKWSGGSVYFNPPEEAVSVTKLDPVGMVKARGELWKAVSVDGDIIKQGIEVKVVRAETLTLYVEEKNNPTKK